MMSGLYMMGGACQCGHRIPGHHSYGKCQYKGCPCQKYVGTEVVEAAIPLALRCVVCLHTYGKHIGIDRCGNDGRGCSCSGFRNPQFFDDPLNPPTPDPAAPGITTTETENHMSKVQTYTLPGGREYIPRNLGGFENDVEGLRELRKTGNHTLLVGEPGVGKTAALLAAFGDKMENEIGHAKLTAFDMMWRPRPLPDGSIQFDPSPLTRAVTQGHPFYFDEIMRCQPDALTPLFSAMDGRDYIVGGNLDGTDMPIKEGFCVFAASNPLVRGAFLPEAIASRFHILEVQVSEELLKRLNLHDSLLTLWRNLSTQEGGEVWRPSVRELLTAQKFLDAGNKAQAAYALTGFRVPAKDRETVADVVGLLLGVRVGRDGGVIK